MKSHLAGWGVALFGLLAAIAAALLQVAARHGLDVDILGWMPWGWLPAGASLLGLLLALGFFVGIVAHHKHPSGGMLMQMVGAAALALVLMYLGAYLASSEAAGQRGPHWPGLQRFVLDRLADALGHAPASRAPGLSELGISEMAALGLQYLALLLGSLGVYVYLHGRASCRACGLYYKHLAHRRREFFSDQAANDYYQRLLTLPMQGPDFEALIRSQARLDRPVQGSYRVDSTLLACPGCGRQVIAERVQSFVGRDWQQLDRLQRQLKVPRDVDLRRAFKA